MKLLHNQMDVLEKELEQLPPNHRIAFAAACCERLYPNCGPVEREIKQRFPKESNSLRKALDKIWMFLASKEVGEEEIRQQISFCEQLRANFEEDPSSPYYETMRYIAEAQNAIYTIHSTLELCLKPSIWNAISVVEHVEDTLYMYLDAEMDKNDPHWRQKPLLETRNIIANHPFSVREMAKESEDLQFLKENLTLNLRILEWLRTSFDNEGKSIIDLC